MMLTRNTPTSIQSHVREQKGILTIGRTPIVAEEFRALIASQMGDVITVDATSYNNPFSNTVNPALYRAVLVIVDSPQAFVESITLIKGVRTNNMASIIVAVVTGSGTYNKMKSYLAGADYCLKLNNTHDESAEVLSQILTSPEWLTTDTLFLNPTRMCLIGNDKKLEISFTETKILEAFSQTRSLMLSHDEIARVMGLNVNFYDPRALEKSISRLRGKIKGMYGTNAFQSIRGYGYRLIRGLISIH